MKKLILLLPLFTSCMSLPQGGYQSYQPPVYNNPVPDYVGTNQAFQQQRTEAHDRAAQQSFQQQSLQNQERMIQQQNVNHYIPVQPQPSYWDMVPH